MGQYDADHNFWLSNESENDSWETESQRSEPGSPLELGGLKPLTKLTANLERARGAMAHLEDMFAQNASLENQEVCFLSLSRNESAEYLSFKRYFISLDVEDILPKIQMQLGKN